MSDQGTPPPQDPGPPSGYGAPPPPPPGHGWGGYPAQPAGPQPENYLVWSILTTVFCCLPLGIVSIVFAAQVSSKWQMGDLAGAQESSRKAKQFAIWAAIIGAIVIVIGIALYAVLIAVAVNSGDFDTYDSY
ncbi:hypothetical protein GCM10011519_26300 [Marmoricola endophyticus]|uniref:CD225/dispanin family protein n=1 Tax=Marmoricola endophyticus TaxID=2040280 RepID=A0A917F400_9ACTN|nr:CD225/dispanin family protein [Marmoricola endophyticus]GGF51056.1 hypothetical protein GCM10011519_26300 [Marmoricola endophyticus]